MFRQELKLKLLYLYSWLMESASRSEEEFGWVIVLVKPWQSAVEKFDLQQAHRTKPMQH